jgi:hypothetical protein
MRVEHTPILGGFQGAQSSADAFVELDVGSIEATDYGDTRSQATVGVMLTLHRLAGPVATLDCFVQVELHPVCEVFDGGITAHVR